MESRIQTKDKLTNWPSPQDYNEAIQNLAANTVDAQLRGGHVSLTELGLPRPLTGAFASVYRVDCHDSAVAVRCFLRDLADQEARYERISDFVQHDSLPYTVTFDFLRQGIRVGANWFPALKMDWVAGPNLDQYIDQNLNDSLTLARLAKDFRQMCMDLHAAGIAHGDLQHGNIIVAKEGLRLVDYDGMFVPAMSGMHSNELGHRNYQHPKRAPHHFNAQLDNFSAWAIYTSICCTALDPTLWDILAGGDDCLLFRRDDFHQPEHSYAFNVLENHPNEDIRRLANHLRWLCHQSIDHVPPLTESPLVVPQFLPPLATPMRAPRQQQVIQQALQHATPHSTAPIAKAQPQPQPTTNINPDVEEELNQPTPRWVAKTPEATLLSTFIDQDLVANGIPARTIQLSIKKNRDSEGVEHSVAHYKFPVNNKVVTGEMRVTDTQAVSLAKAKQVTVLYYPRRTERNAIYACLPFRAIDIAIPKDIEPELVKRRRAVKRRNTHPYRFYYGAFMTFMFMSILLLLVSIQLQTINLWFAAATVALPWLVCAQTQSHHSQLVATGVPTRARVIDTHLIDNRGIAVIKYRFQTYIGPIQESITTNDTSLVNAKLGDKITVLYDINSPYNHIVYKNSVYQA